MKKYLYISIAILPLFQGCCWYSYETNPAGLISYAEEKMDNDYYCNILWYRGTDGEYDYFSYVYGMLQSQDFKVKKDKIKLERKFPYTSDNKKWLQIKEMNVQWTFGWEGSESQQSPLKSIKLQQNDLR